MSIDTCYYEDFIELLPVGVILIGGDLQIKGYNTKAIELIGIEDADILIGNINKQSYNTLLSFASKMFSNNTSSAQQLIELNNNFLSFTAQMINKNNHQDLIIIIKDSTSINSLEKIRRDYIGTILHSIRTPLATLTNSLNILSTTASELLTGDKAEALAMSISEVLRLNVLIDNLKELFYIESNLAQSQIRLVQTTFKSLIDNVLKLLFQNDDISMQNLNRFSIEGDQNILINIDIIKMTQSIYNILKNAIIYSPPDNPVFISICKIDTVVVIEIKDSGIGIRSENMLSVFSKFFREDNDVNRKNYGYGLGLFLAKSWIELMNGTIICESSQSAGTVFTITLVNNNMREKS